MRRLVAIVFLGLCLTVSGARAQQVVAGLSQTRVAITTWFSGSEIFIYGAIKRDRPAEADAPLDVVVAVTGPSTPLTVRKKDRTFGIWVNGPGVRIDAAPSFYAVATTRGFRDVMSWTDDMRYRIGLGEVIRLIDAPKWVEQTRQEYIDAVVRLRENEGVYYEKIGGVTLTEQTLFDTRIELPAQLVEGDYTARIFLTRNREVIDNYETSIAVRKVGIEHWVDLVAHDYSAIYGVLSIVMALAAGWGASALFRALLP